MADIRLHGFRGKRPYVKTEHLLGYSDASDCDDTIFESGLLRGVKDDTEEQAADVAYASSETLYQYPVTNAWFSFTEATDIVTAVKSSTDEILMYSDGLIEPRFTNNTLIGAGPVVSAYRTVGITAPTAAPTVVVTGSANAEPSYDSRSYVYTWVDSVSGMESAPSPASDLVTLDVTDQAVDVTMSTTAPVDGTYNVDKKRIYRTVTGTATTEYLFVTEINLATATYNDSKSSADVGEALITTDWARPPTTMNGVCAHPAGFFCGFDGNTLCFSEPGYFYAWPLKYQIDLEFPIVGIMPIGGNLAVMTEGVPYIVAGTSPYNMVPRKLDSYLPCVSKRSITDMGGFCIYAGDDSLVMVSAQGAQSISKGILTRKQWKAKTPSNIFGARWRGLYMAIYPTYVDVWAPGALEVGITTINSTYKSAYTDPGTGDVYMVDNLNAIQNFADDDTSSSTTWQWVSKPFMFMEPINFACVRALGTFEGTITIAADSSAPSDVDDSYTYTTPAGALADNVPIRLPKGIKYKTCRITIDGVANDELHELHFATSIQELPGTSTPAPGG